MKLYGSATSPYVRRLRIWLEHADYEFVAMDIFLPEGRKQLEAVSPARKIPLLQLGKDTIYDSRVIFYHLNDRLQRETVGVREDNQLTLIDEANTAFVQLFLLKKSGVDVDQDALYFNLQRERINNLMMHLEGMVSSGHFDNWNYPAICLYCLLDWIDFREQFQLESTPALKTFRDANTEREYVISTDPRR
ncbi:glutathione S-transferase family protein [Marinospirillum alkaliphilum]|uniref:Glutathione S-transferase n=1 Tax=Marinospirillum alkaliphilum DSM 21637 TaxID=1122209 RepID=A0A1K1U1S6_9GAMM|nr:glutathione S-transferase family protein [Marinospirillum alkaliphilum]SFX06331.1 glutathione S-transferase [Marinospirillum alkaliphilum DSM 21637]